MTAVWDALKRAPWFLILVVAGAVVPFPFGNNAFLLLFFSNMILFVILAIGLQVLFGWAGMFMLSQAAFYGIGAYAAAIAALDLHWPFLLQVVAGIVATCLAALVIAPIVRLRAVYYALASFVFGVMVSALLSQLPMLGGGNGINNLPTASIFGFVFQSPVSQYYLTFAGAVLAYGFFYRLQGSYFGMHLNAIRSNELAARTVGMNIPKSQIVGTLLGVSVAGLAGAILVGTNGFISPDEFGVNQSLLIIAMLVVGGVGVLPGSIWGAGIIYLITTYTEGLAQYVNVVYGGIIVLTMMLLPQGLWGIVTRRVRRSSHMYLRGSPRARETPPAPRAKAPPKGGTLVSIEGVSKQFGGVRAVSGVSFTVERGSIHGLIGPNGAGKTSLLNLLCGVYFADEGRIAIAGRDVTRVPLNRRVDVGIGRTYQQAQLFSDMTVAENVALGAYRSMPSGLLSSLVQGPGYHRWTRRTMASVSELLSFVGLEEIEVTTVRDLPYGLQKLTEIGRALASEPEFLVMDEPAAGLNLEEIRRLERLIRGIQARGITVLLVEHNMSLVMNVCDHISVLNFGEKIAEGTPDQVRSNDQVIEAYLGRSKHAIP